MGGCRRGYTHFEKGLFSSDDESETPELRGNGLISVAINVWAESANEDALISLGLYNCISVLPEPKVRLVGAVEMSDTAENSDENITCLIELPSRLSMLRQKNVQKACAHFVLEAALRGFCSYWERVKQNTIRHSRDRASRCILS